MKYDRSWSRDEPGFALAGTWEHPGSEEWISYLRRDGYSYLRIIANGDRIRVEMYGTGELLHDERVDEEMTVRALHDLAERRALYVAEVLCQQ